MSDLLMPIVFPDYQITVETPATKIKLPDYLPYIDIFPSEIQVPHTKNKFSDLGHAGVLFVNGKTGTTKYYEYGRYDPKQLGWVKKILMLPDSKVDSNGNVTEESLVNVLRVISNKAGKRGRISSAYIQVDDKFEDMLKYAKLRMEMNSNPNREQYDITSYSCVHFMKGVLEAAGVDAPWIIDPRPTSYIKEIQDDFPAVEFSPSDSKLKMEETSSLLGL